MGEGWKKIYPFIYILFVRQLSRWRLSGISISIPVPISIDVSSAVLVQRGNIGMQSRYRDRIMNGAIDANWKRFPYNRAGLMNEQKKASSNIFCIL
jgi:hypothetical protein